MNGDEPNWRNPPTLMILNPKQQRKYPSLLRHIREGRLSIRHAEVILEDLNLLKMVMDENRSRLERNIRKKR